MYDLKVEQGKPMKKSDVAKQFGLHPRTFANYAHDNHSKRLQIGSKVGRPSVVTEEDREFVVQSIIRSDRANEGMRCGDAIANLVSLTEDTSKPLSHPQASNYVYKTLRNDKHLKKKLVIAQKTTSKRSMSNVAQQWRWFRNVMEALNRLRRENTGVCRKTTLS